MIYYEADELENYMNNPKVILKALKECYEEGNTEGIKAICKDIDSRKEELGLV